MTNASRLVEPESFDTTEDLGLDVAPVADIVSTNRGVIEGASAVEQELQEAQATEQPQLPEKFKNKSTEDIVDMYTNLEKELGRKGQEIGELRHLTDSILRNQLQSNTQDTPQETSEETTDFFDDPEGKVKRLIQKEVAPLKEQEKRNGQVQFVDKLRNTYPDFEQTIASQEFMQFIEASPYRAKMFAEADNYDWDAANELLSTFKALNTSATPAEPSLNLPNVEESVHTPTPEEKAKRDTQLKAATVERGSTGETTRKVFRRADLINLLRTDPERYQALEPEIRKAYREGRVR